MQKVPKEALYDGHTIHCFTKDKENVNKMLDVAVHFKLRNNADITCAT